MKSLFNELLQKKKQCPEGQQLTCLVLCDCLKLLQRDQQHSLNQFVLTMQDVEQSM
jgi:hypothetical protein